jgi:cytochrome c oxidase cbb3-type subunit I/II
MWAAGITQGLMWMAFDQTGRLLYPDFVETTLRLMPMYWVRVLGGLLFLTGGLAMVWNMYMTWRSRPRPYNEEVHEAPALDRLYVPPADPATDLEKNPSHFPGFALTIAKFNRAAWHRRWEGMPLVFSVWVAIAVIVASLFEIIPTFLIKSNVPTIESVKPYTPLELYGRDIYISEGCYNCHSQMIRPFRAETDRYGDYSKPGEFVYDHPFQWGSRRIGPDLQRVGGKYPDLWHVRHMREPREVTPGSVMPVYPWLLKNDTPYHVIQKRVDVMVMLGVPYGEAVNRAEEMAREQAAEIAARVEEQGGPKGLVDKQIIPLVAYLQRLGTDLNRPAVVEEDEGGVGEGTEAEPGAEGGDDADPIDTVQAEMGEH